jgi:hypothetical protein
MATFGANSFDERGSGGGRDFPAHGAKAEIVVIIRPGGSPLVQHIGPAPQDFSVPGQGTEAQLDALRGAVGDAATLTYVGGAISARLKAVSGALKIKDERDLWRFDLQFVR